MSYSEDEYLMLSGIQHFCFCRRQWALIHLEQQCAEMGLSISFLSRSGKFLCRTEGTTSGNVLLRRQQYRMADQSSERLKIAKSMITGKIFNSRYVLERAIRDHGLRIDVEKMQKESEFLRIAAQRAWESSDLDSLRGIEREAASVYFSVWDDLILLQTDQDAVRLHWIW